MRSNNEPFLQRLLPGVGQRAGGPVLRSSLLAWSFRSELGTRGRVRAASSPSSVGSEATSL